MSAKVRTDFSRLVDIREIVENDYNLNMSIYLPKSEPEETMNLHTLSKKRSELKQEADRIETVIEEHLRSLRGNDHYFQN